jgi:hypothetical protein
VGIADDPAKPLMVCRLFDHKIADVVPFARFPPQRLVAFAGNRGRQPTPTARVREVETTNRPPKAAEGSAEFNRWPQVARIPSRSNAKSLALAIESRWVDAHNSGSFIQGWSAFENSRHVR